MRLKLLKLLPGIWGRKAIETSVKFVHRTQQTRKAVFSTLLTDKFILAKNDFESGDVFAECGNKFTELMEAATVRVDDPGEDIMETSLTEAVDASVPGEGFSFSVSFFFGCFAAGGCNSDLGGGFLLSLFLFFPSEP